jgi:hypothetical protein
VLNIMFYFRYKSTVVGASMYSRTELVAYRTEPCYTGAPKKVNSAKKWLIGVSKVRFGIVRHAKKSMRALYDGKLCLKPKW